MIESHFIISILDPDRGTEQKGESAPKVGISGENKHQILGISNESWGICMGQGESVGFLQIKGL